VDETYASRVEAGRGELRCEEVVLSYGQAGSGPPPAVVFLHGLSSAASAWRNVAPQIARTHRVYWYDHRGHGATPATPGRYRVEHYADDARQFISEVAGSPAVLVGASLGGLVAAHLAGIHPELVHAVYLSDPPLYLGDRREFEATIYARLFPVIQAALRRARDAGGTEADYRAAIHSIPAGPGGLSMGDLLGEEGLGRQARTWSAFDPEAFTPAIDRSMYAAFDPERPIACPVRVVRADPRMEPAFTGDHEARLRSVHPRADVVVAEGSPHGIHEAKPDWYVADLRAFLSS